MIPGICKYNLILHFIWDLLRVKRPSEPDPISSNTPHQPEGLKSAQVLAGRTWQQQRLIHVEHAFNCPCGVVSNTRTMPAFSRWFPTPPHPPPPRFNKPRLRLSERFGRPLLLTSAFRALRLGSLPQLWTCFSSNQGGHSPTVSNKVWLCEISPLLSSNSRALT